jgi:hypothetical protein
VFVLQRKDEKKIDASLLALREHLPDFDVVDTSNELEIDRLVQSIKDGKMDCVLLTAGAWLPEGTIRFLDLLNLCLSRGIALSGKGLHCSPNSPDVTDMVRTLCELPPDTPFSEAVSKGTSAAINHLAKTKAQIPGGPVVFGFDRHPTKKGQWVVNKTEIKLVVQMMERFVATSSYAEVVKLGILGKSGKPFSRGSIVAMMANKKYIGLLDLPGETEPVPLLSGVAVPPDLFERVQATAKTIAKKDESAFLLNGLIFCDGVELAGQLLQDDDGVARRYYVSTDGKKFGAFRLESALFRAIGASMQGDMTSKRAAIADLERVTVSEDYTMKVRRKSHG